MEQLTKVTYLTSRLVCGVAEAEAMPIKAKSKRTVMNSNFMFVSGCFSLVVYQQFIPE
jgi:hypothetical protein